MAELLGRGRQTASAALRAQHGTDIGKTQLNALLNVLLSPEKRFGEEAKEWCMWLIAGGESPDVFLAKLRVYDSSRTCGLVWHKNFVAYRCRDCGTSPCMSICADCFHKGDHRGHDYNMFRSQAGGACDCGDENVMKKEGFCSSHGKMSVSAGPPNDVLCMARAVIPHLFNRLYKEVESSSSSEDSITSVNDDIDELMQFLQELCKGEVMRSVTCDVIVQQCQDITHSSTDITCSIDSETLLCRYHLDYCEIEPITYLGLLLEITIKLDFPENLVTFLLQLLPNQKYKVAFTQQFCQKYQEIGKALTLCSTLEEVEKLSNSVVHISVQLFSNQILVEKMVREQNLLHIMIKVIHEMVRTTFQPMKVNDRTVQHLVINCDKTVIKYHCYWPVISDLINVLTHDGIAFIFMQDVELIEKWMTFLACLTGMNGNKRVISHHVEYESTSFNAAYSIEIEAAAAPMWSLIAASSLLNNKSCIMTIFHHATIALNKWLKKVSLKPSRSEVTFHFPLLRYVAAFVRQGMSQFSMGLQDFRWDFSLLTRILEWPTSIQAAICEVRAGSWVRNGNQIQVQSSWYKQCHFCNSMFDLDIFFMQICAALLDPDYFLNALLNRFRVHDWFQFRAKIDSNLGIDDDVKEIMVEGVLTLIVTLLTCRLHFGMKEEETLRLEMVTTLCFADRTHSQLVKMVPERSGQTVNTQLFEKVLKEIADYKHPGCDSSGMQQGMYTLKQEIWDSDFDPVHAMMREFNRSEFQSAMDRYTAHVRQRDSRVGCLWPPFRPLKPVPESFNGIFRLLHCKTLHRMLYFILHKATSNVTPVSESIIYLTIHLITLAIQSRPSLFEMLPHPYTPSMSDVSDAGCIVVSKCLTFLNTYGNDIKNLHRDEDYSRINNTLFSEIFSDPESTLNPNKVSVREISLILGHTLHYNMEPPLFYSILPFMNTVLSDALNNSCSQNERESQLRHIQFLLETLPVHRYNVVKKLIAYLVKFIKKEDIPMKNISIIFDDSQPLELTMLFMYLIKYHEQLFRVYQPPDGLPRDISTLDFPSNNLVENIRHEPVILESHDSNHSGQVKTPEEDTAETSVSSSSTLTSSTQSPENLVQEFIDITNASIDTAIFLLEQCQKHLETAVNIYFESTQSFDETMSESSSNMAMEIDLESVLTTSESRCCRENLSLAGSADTANVSGEHSFAGGHLTDSILSLLMKLKTVLSLSVTSTQSCRSPGVTTVKDGVRKLEKLLEIISQSSSSNVEAICKFDTPSCSLSPTNDVEDPLAKQELKRKRARERQQKVMDEFASKQKEFLENVCEQEGSEEVDNGVCCKRSLTELFDCAICGQQGVPSSEEEPMGYVAFLQSGSVLKHRRRSDSSRMLCISTEPSSTHSCCCGSVYAARKKFLSTYFNKVAATQASELGIDGGVHIQSCGHCLHLKCQQSYLQCITQEQHSHQTRAFDPSKGEFICPVCRRLGNAILPILPSDVMAPTCSKSKETSHQDVMAELEMTLKNCSSNNWTRFTTSALKLSALNASISSLVENINRLDLSKERDLSTMSENKFSLIVETARSNLEAEHIAIQTGKLFCKRRPFYGTLIRTLQYQSQTLVRPLFHVLALLTGKPVESYDVKLDTEITRNDVPLLLRDGVSLLLQLMLSWPAPCNLRSFRCLAQIVFNVVFIQALVKTCCTFTADERLSWQVLANKCQEKRPSGLTTDALLGFVCSLLGDSKLCQESQECPGISQSVWSPHTVESTIQKLCLPFLRTVSSLSTLCYSTDHPDIQDEESEFFLLTLSLGLHQQPEPSSLLSVSDCFKCSHGCPLFLVKQWCKQLCTISRSNEIFPKDLIPGTDDWQAPRLFPLPKHYDKLFQTYRKKKCVKCGTNPDEPTLCLVCGTFVCLRGRCCEREKIRECVEHAMECGYGTAVFLIMMSSSIFIIRGEKASVWGSVYLDEFGEEDIDLRRGKPLFLCTDRYQRLEEQWITHTFDSICKTWMRHNNNL